MAIVYGKAGSASWTDASGISVTEGEMDWILEITGEVIDITSMDDATFKARLGSWRDWTATVTSVDSGDVNYTEAKLFASLGETNVLTLADGTKTWTSASNGAMLVGWSKNLDVNDVIKFTWNFEGTAAITVA